MTYDSGFDNAAYLILREGSQWRDVYKLLPGQVMTVGRAGTNRLLLHDDICSRNHCEVFLSGSTWVLRDLDSRNGTRVNGQRIERDTPLRPGNIIQIGSTELAFTLNLADTLPQLSLPIDHRFESDTGTQHEASTVDVPVVEPEILRRQRDSRLNHRTDSESIRDRTSRELARLYRLGMRMGTATDSRKLAEVVLEGLLESTHADIGAILLPPPELATAHHPGSLQVLAYQSKFQIPYAKVSDFLSRAVLTDGEALLARDVASDERLVGRDSLGALEAQSVICAPLRVGPAIRGLVHLYCTKSGQQLDDEDLDFTLAVADQCAPTLDGLRRQETLTDGLERVRDENRVLREQLDIESEIVGQSPPMQQLQEKILRCAPTDAIVLVLGESGVGKELVSRAIHFRSRRRQGPFVCLNCAALSETLLESELFGHEKGSFTGAVSRKIGKYEQAHQGTLFLDEIGEMSPVIQAKFLRVLEGQPFERVGGSVPVTVNVRVVAATNRNLEDAVAQGRFRQDLYFRLNVIEILVPPLREHPADILLLANHFLERFRNKVGRNIRGIAPAAMAQLTRYDWPGNVRELRNTIERAVILCGGDQISPADIQLSRLRAPEPSRSDPVLPVITTPPSTAEATETLEKIEERHILQVLESTQGNKSQAAAILGIERSTLDRKLKRYRELSEGTGSDS